MSVEGGAGTSPVQPLRRPPANTQTKILPVATVRSPSFAARVPQLINANLVEPHILHATAGIWRRAHFEGRDVEVYHLQRVYAIGLGMIFDESLNVISAVSEPASEGEIETHISCIKTWSSDGRVGKFAQGIVAKKRGAANYGHFLLEMLPMAAVARELAQAWGLDPVYWVEFSDPPLLDVMLRAFRQIGVPLNRLLLKRRDEPVFFDNLLIVRGLTEHGSYMSPWAVELTAALASNEPRAVGRRLFVMREPSVHGRRPFTNQDHVADRLRHCGYDIVDPGKLSLDEQVDIFRHARLVVGASGAAMSNIVFCTPGTRIINLVGSRFPDTFFWFISTHRRHHYLEIRCVQEASTDEVGWTGAMTLSNKDIDFLEKFNPGDVPDLFSSSTDGDRYVDAEVMVHVKNLGDVTSGLHQFAGIPGSGLSLEGFQIAPINSIPPEAIEYYATSASRPRMGWFTGGAFCGTRGLGVEINGFGIKVSNRYQHRVKVLYSATFTDGSIAKERADGEMCAAETGAPLESLMVRIIGSEVDRRTTL